MPRALLIQLARLGDLVQSLPVITALHSLQPEHPLDLLCPAPLVPLGQLFPGISTVYPWDGALWQSHGAGRSISWKEQMRHISQDWTDQAYPAYTVAYNLNNHPRGILAAHLFSDRVIGPGESGPLNPALPSWAGHLRQIAGDRGNNRIHLADAFCGMCQLLPPANIPQLKAPNIPLPLELERIVNEQSSMTVGIILGAGDVDRRIPLSVWQDLIVTCAELLPESYLLLIGGEGEREAALALEQRLPTKYMNQVVNGCGRTSLPQLVGILNRCRWVIGSDTGPLHLGAMCGARVIGWYFSRARVHETGPYGEGHYVWQYGKNHSGDSAASQLKSSLNYWPVTETVNLMMGKQRSSTYTEWNLWTSHRDEWGAFYVSNNNPDLAVSGRKDTWKALSKFMNRKFQMEVSR